MLNWMDVHRTFADLDVLMDRAIRQELGRAANRDTRGFQAGLRDEGEAFVLRAELPGVAKEAIDLQVTAEAVTLAATRKSEAPAGAKLLRRERADVEISKRWNLSARIDVDAVSAQVVDGILTVRLPKASAVAPRRISVQPL